MSVPLVKEVSVYDAFAENIVYKEVSCGGCAWKVASTEAPASPASSLCDTNLAATLI
jgi:hypothetical protein